MARTLWNWTGIPLKTYQDGMATKIKELHGILHSVHKISGHQA